MSNKENLEMRYLILSPTSLCVDLLRRIWKIKKSSNNRLELLNLLVYILKNGIFFKVHIKCLLDLFLNIIIRIDIVSFGWIIIIWDKRNIIYDYGNYLSFFVTHNYYYRSKAKTKKKRAVVNRYSFRMAFQDKLFQLSSLRGRKKIWFSVYKLDSIIN